LRVGHCLKVAGIGPRGFGKDDLGRDSFVIGNEMHRTFYADDLVIRRLNPHDTEHLLISVLGALRAHNYGQAAALDAQAGHQT